MMKKKVLLIRLDKIGDLICTLCVDQAAFLKDCEVRWAISQGLAFVPEHADPKRTYIELSKDNWKISLAKLRDFLKDYKPDVAVSFQAPWWVSYALWLEKIPVRAGVRSQWHSFLFLNRGLRQRRSKAVQHEADYNMDLLRHALSISTSSSEKAPILKLTASENSILLSQHSLEPQKYLVVHPGMAGSALNWPIKNYIELIEQSSQKWTVVLTGTAADEPWLKEIKAHLKLKNNPHVRCLQGLLNPSELFSILKQAKAVVVPSTGVAHMAASLGTPVLGLYSPIRVQHPRRWAPRGKSVKVFLPPINENAPVDPHCMEQIKVQDLLTALEEI